MRLIHITDPHLSSLSFTRFSAVRGKRRSGYLSWHRKRRHVHRRDILDRLTESVQAEDADQFLVGGDLVHIGLEQEISAAREWLQQLAPPEKILLVPGNHDIYAADSFGAVNEHWSDYLAASPGPENHASGYPLSRDLGPVHLTGVNSSLPTPIFSARGEVGRGQIERLPRSYSAERVNFVLIHHPPLPGLTHRRKALRDVEAFGAWLERSGPDIALYGHVHGNRSLEFGATRVYCTASASCREKASYRIFDVERENGAWRISMQLKQLEPDTGGRHPFRVTEQDEWRRPASRQQPGE
jgi:3',5'-cyclic AMP phosphodiesterase CpdA